MANTMTIKLLVAIYATLLALCVKTIIVASNALQATSGTKPNQIRNSANLFVITANTIKMENVLIACKAVQFALMLRFVRPVELVILLTHQKLNVFLIAHQLLITAFLRNNV